MAGAVGVNKEGEGVRVAPVEAVGASGVRVAASTEGVGKSVPLGVELALASKPLAVPAGEALAALALAVNVKAPVAVHGALLEGEEEALAQAEGREVALATAVRVPEAV